MTEQRAAQIRKEFADLCRLRTDAVARGHMSLAMMYGKSAIRLATGVLAEIYERKQARYLGMPR
jgi:hypothetical protein